MSENVDSQQELTFTRRLMFGKVFASLYQGSLRGQAHEILVFTNMIACADREGFVDKHPRAIAEECGITIEEVRAAIVNLEAPDPESRTPDQDGRRLLKIDVHRPWGWKLTNYLKYRDLKDEETRRETFRISQRKTRARQQASTGVNRRQPESSLSTQAEVEAEEEKDVSGKPDPIGEIIDHLNATAGTSYRATTEASRKFIAARLAGGATVAECVAVIDAKVAEWLGTEQAKYLRPATLFNAEKFEGYRGALTMKTQSKGGPSYRELDGPPE